MKVTVQFQGQQRYLPNNRCKHKRTRIYYDTHEVDVKEVTEMPIAFRVTDYQTLYPGKDEVIQAAPGEKLRKEYNEGCKLYKEEPYNTVSGFIVTDIGYLDGKCYRKMRAGRFGMHAGGTCGPEALEKCIRCDGRMIGYSCYPDMPFVEGKSKVIWDSRSEQIQELEEEAERYVLFNGEVWEECGEPMYYGITFGLGHNHASTDLMIDYFYNCNLPNESYFRADQLEEAIEYTKQVALRRGDTNSVEGIVNGKSRIQVLIPEAVKRDPAKEHGDGDPFQRMLYGLTEQASSVTEAAALVMVASMKQTG